MNAKAFIIAIEDYSQGNYLPSLKGVNDDANVFYKWLVDVKKLTADSIYACADKNGCAWATANTTSRDIRLEMRKFLIAAREQSSEIYFYFSGHGFSYKTSPLDDPVDFLVAPDFSDPEIDVDACLGISRIIETMKKSLGPAEQYFFVDACRNEIDSVNPAPLGIEGKYVSLLGTKTVYKLFSTAQGNVGERVSGFTNALVDGLSGKGNAKNWYQGRLWVMFGDLCDYVNERIEQLNNQQADPEIDGIGKGLILDIQPIPNYDCNITIANATAKDSFTLKVSDGGGNKIINETFKGDSHKFSVKPNFYYISLSHPTVKVVQVKPPPSDAALNLFDALDLHFKLDTTPAPKAITATANIPKSILGKPVNVMFTAFHDAQIQFENLKNGYITTAFGNFNRKVEPGEYLVKLRANGVKVGSKKLNIKAGENIKLNLLDRKLNPLNRPQSPVREKLIETIAGENYSQSTKFKKSLGTLANLDLGLLLSLLGAARIVAAPEEYPKLSKLPLASFDKMAKDASPVYVLAGFEKSKGTFGIGTSDDATVDWQKMSKVKTLAGIYEKLVPSTPGAHLLSIKIPKYPPLTYAIFCLPNRATFVIFTQDVDGRLTIHQYILPIRKLYEHLDSRIREQLQNKPPLEIVQQMFSAQTQFARNRPLTGEMNPLSAGDWIDLIHGKWLDPVMSLIGAYEMIRRGLKKNDKELLQRMIGNLRKFFPGIPDTEAIAKIIGEPWDENLRGAPLLLDGVFAHDENQEQRILPLPHNRVDYNSAWTSWRGGVNDFETQRKRK